MNLSVIFYLKQLKGSYHPQVFCISNFCLPSSFCFIFNFFSKSPSNMITLLLVSSQISSLYDFHSWQGNKYQTANSPPPHPTYPPPNLCLKCCVDTRDESLCNACRLTPILDTGYYWSPPELQSTSTDYHTLYKAKQVRYLPVQVHSFGAAAVEKTVRGKSEIDSTQSQPPELISYQWRLCWGGLHFTIKLWWISIPQ